MRPPVVVRSRPKGAGRWWLAGLTALALVSANAQQSTPSSDALGLSSEGFHVVAPFPAGGPIDLLARLLAGDLAERYKVTAVVDNVPVRVRILYTGQR